MSVTCIVVGCWSRGDRDYHLSYFRIPSILKSVHYPEINELSKKRRQKWLAAIKRDDLSESILRNQRVCSGHFITGKPSTLKNDCHPDWAPQQHLGHDSHVHLKRKTDVDRKNRADKRMKYSEKATDKMELIDIATTSDQVVEQEDTGCATQTELTMGILTLKLEQLSFAANKIEELKTKIENSPLGLMENTEHESLWKYYTGFDYEFVEKFF